MTDYSMSPEGEKFPIPRQDEYAADTFYSKFLRKLGLKATEHSQAITRTSASINKLLNWITHNTDYNESFFADFFLSPTILTYADRPIILHCFFQSDIPIKYREQAEKIKLHLFRDSFFLINMMSLSPHKKICD